MKTFCIRLVILLLTMGLLSCGYHLRGNTQIAEQALPVYLTQDDGFHALRRELLNQLRQSNIATTTDSVNAASVISIVSMKKWNSVISVDSLGRTSEVKLGLVVEVSISVNKILSRKKIHVYKDVAFNPENILSYKKEEAILYAEMNTEVSRLLLLQLQAKANQAF